MSDPLVVQRMENALRRIAALEHATVVHDPELIMTGETGPGGDGCGWAMLSGADRALLRWVARIARAALPEPEATDSSTPQPVTDLGT